MTQVDIIELIDVDHFSANRSQGMPLDFSVL